MEADFAPPNNVSSAMAYSSFLEPTLVAADRS
jgi:hypothetical protein